MNEIARVAGIFVYPVKSTAGVALSEAVIEARGISGDRRWLVTDAQGEYLTGREFPALVQIRAAPIESGIRLSAPRMPDLHVSTPDTRGRRTPVLVWVDRCSALPADDDAGAWFSDFLQTDCQLVFMDADCVRPLPGPRGLASDQVSFADNFPLLAVSRASLDDLSIRVGEPVDMRRFRPNLVFDNCGAYAEDGWRRLLIGEVAFDGVERCSRCGFTIIDPDTATRHPAQEPLRTLGQYRRGSDGAVYFGQNLIPRKFGTVRVGDKVAVAR